MNEELFRERDRIVGNAQAYAASEGLTDLGLLQAAVRFALVDGWFAGRFAEPGQPNPFIHQLREGTQ